MVSHNLDFDRTASMPDGTESRSPRFLDRFRIFLPMVAVLAFYACGDPSGPEGSTLTFRADPISCAGGAAVEITIDGESRGALQFAPGSEWSFSVSAGTHDVLVQGEEPDGGLVNVEREVNVPENGNFTVLFGCSS